MPGQFIPAGPYVPDGGGPSGGPVAHNDTTNRNNPTAHTIGAVQGLRAVLDGIATDEPLRLGARITGEFNLTDPFYSNAPSDGTFALWLDNPVITDPDDEDETIAQQPGPYNFDGTDTIKAMRPGQTATTGYWLVAYEAEYATLFDILGQTPSGKDGTFFVPPGIDFDNPMLFSEGFLLAADSRSTIHYDRTLKDALRFGHVDVWGGRILVDGWPLTDASYTAVPPGFVVFGKPAGAALAEVYEHQGSSASFVKLAGYDYGHNDPVVLSIRGDFDTIADAAAAWAQGNIRPFATYLMPAGWDPSYVIDGYRITDDGRLDAGLVFLVDDEIEFPIDPLDLPGIMEDAPSGGLLALNAQTDPADNGLYRKVGDDKLVKLSIDTNVVFLALRTAEESATPVYSPSGVRIISWDGTYWVPINRLLTVENHRLLTSADTILPMDQNLEVDTSEGEVSLAMSDFVGSINGRKVTFYNSGDTNDLILVGTISGVVDTVISPGDALTVCVGFSGLLGA